MTVEQLTADQLYLETFFEETDKVDPELSFEVSVGYTFHQFTYGVVIEALMSASPAEQKFAADTIRKIDFANGDPQHFLRHLGECLAREHGKG